MTAAEELAFFGRNDPGLKALRGMFDADNRCIAAAGVMRDPRFYQSMFEEDGAWIGFLQLAPGASPIGAHAVVAMRHWLKNHADMPIQVQHEGFQPKAERLLTILGFKPTDKYQADFRKPSRKLRIWIWQPPQHSQPS